MSRIPCITPRWATPCRSLLHQGEGVGGGGWWGFHHADASTSTGLIDRQLPGMGKPGNGCKHRQVVEMLA